LNIYRKPTALRNLLVWTLEFFREEIERIPKIQQSRFRHQGSLSYRYDSRNCIHSCHLLISKDSSLT